MRIVRLTVLGSLALALVFLVGCKSGNKDKIVGTWESTAPIPPGTDKDLGLKCTIEFTADGEFTIYESSPSTPREALNSGKYSLGDGDTVLLTDITPSKRDGRTSSTESISINGDALTMKFDKSSSMTFKKVTP